MRRTLAPMAVVLSMVLAAPVPAQDAPATPRNPDLSEGFNLLEEGARLMLRGLIEEMGPALREMEDGLRQLHDLVGDMAQYHAPEMLPNGDILIRRRTPLAPDAPGLPGDTPHGDPEAEIEL